MSRRDRTRGQGWAGLLVGVLGDGCFDVEMAKEVEFGKMVLERL